MVGQGELKAKGATSTIITHYLSAREGFVTTNLADRKDRRWDGRLLVPNIEFADGNGIPVSAFESGREARILLRYAGKQAPLKNVVVHLAIDSIMGDRVVTLSNEFSGDTIGDFPKAGVLICTVPRLSLNVGQYTCTLFITVNGRIADWISGACSFSAESGDFFSTGKHPDMQDRKILMSHRWEMTTKQETDV